MSDDHLTPEDNGATFFLALMVCIVAAGVILFGMFVISGFAWFLLGYLFP